MIEDGAEFLDLMVGQITHPVNWAACMRTMADLGVTDVVELPPAGVLAGLVRKGLPKTAIIAIKMPDDLQRF